VVLPPVAYGVTRYGSMFPGAVGITPPTLRAMLIEILDSLAQQELEPRLIVNSHFEPEHLSAVREAAGESRALLLDLTRRHHAERIGGEFQRGAAHAGRYETSLVLATHPELVDVVTMRGLPAVDVDMPAAMAEGRHDFLAMGMDRAYCGAPAESSAEEGSTTLSVLAEMVVDAIVDWNNA